MFSNRDLVRKVVSRVRAAARETVEDLVSTRAELEPQLTDRLAARIQDELNGKRIAGVMWRVKTLTDRVKNSQEKYFGADLLAVLDLELSGFAVKKGFLAQAKRVEPSDSFTDWKRLHRQCEDMLANSPASYVFLYSAQSGILVIPAVSVVGARPCNPHELTAKPLAEFFGDHLECFIGDPKLQSADVRQLDALRADVAARTAFVLEGRGQADNQLRAS